jgi:predicted Zn-dependent peptidase
VTHPYFTPESVEKEQGIIAQEIRMGDDNPSSQRYYQLLRALYGNRQIYTQICGTVESIAQITDQTLYDCYRVFYNLSNMVLVICGDVDVDTVLSVADRILPVQEKVEILRDRPEEPRGVIHSKLSWRMEIAQPIFAIGIKDDPFGLAPADRVRRSNALDILCEMLFNQSGELFNSLYREGLITGSLGFGYDEGRTYAFVGLSGESPDPDAVMERVKATVEDAKKNGLSSTDFTRCKRVMYAELVREFDSTTDIADLILDAVQSKIEPFDFVSILDSVTFEDVETVLHEVFRPEAYALSVIYPKEEQN